MQTLSLEELESESGIPVRTIRFYIAGGYLPKADRHGVYSTRHLIRLKLILKHKQMGMRLDSLSGMAEWPDEQVTSLLGDEPKDKFFSLHPLPIPMCKLVTTADMPNALKLSQKLLKDINVKATRQGIEYAEAVHRSLAQRPPAAETWERRILADGLDLMVRLPASPEVKSLLARIIHNTLQ